MSIQEVEEDLKDLNEDLNKRIKSDRIEAHVFEKYIGSNGVFHEASISVSNGSIQETKQNIETLSKNSKSLSRAVIGVFASSLVCLLSGMPLSFGILTAITIFLYGSSEHIKNKIEIENETLSKSLFNVSALNISALDSKTFVNLLMFKGKEKEIAFSIFIEHFCNNLEEILLEDESRYFQSLSDFETSPVIKAKLQSRITKKAISDLKKDPRYLELLKSEEFSKILKAS